MGGVCRVSLPGGRVQPDVCCLSTSAEIALEMRGKIPLQLPARHCGRTPPDTD